MKMDIENGAGKLGRQLQKKKTITNKYHFSEK